MTEIQKINHLFERLGLDYKIKLGDPIQESLFVFVNTILDKIEDLDKRLKVYEDWLNSYNSLEGFK